MLFVTIIKVAVKCLVANKLRSFLAVLGIIIGVAAVIANLAIGAGARKQVVDRISAMGSNLLSVRPKWMRSAGVGRWTVQRIALDEAEALLREIPEIRMASPVVRGDAQLKYFNKNTPCEIYGVGPTYCAVRSYEIEHGRFFNDTECDGMAHVAVLGPTTVQNLFPSNSIPLGKSIKINGMQFKIIGITKAKGDVSRGNPDDRAHIPYTVAMKQVLGKRWLDEINLQVADADKMDLACEKATALLRKMHRLAEGQEDDFWIRNQAELLDTAVSVTRTFTVLLGAVAGVSLLVGGIGIMNIMLVTVTERTREIGIRKAIGAKRRDIVVQFLLESVIMSVIGGFTGATVGVASAWIIGKATQYMTTVHAGNIFLALTVSIAVGVFFGFYPARRAALLTPIDALRYE
ncbi:FtsX-like permease family protein [bacterium]|nr:FtsX-like permease family protein [bacterium]